ncbi:MAG: DUF1492 domain-containing protein [Faecousia sp.]
MTKDELLQYRDLAREVRQLRRHLDSLESSMYTPQGQRYTATPRAASGPGKTMADAVCQHMELEDLYREKLAERNAQLLRVEAAIDSLANPGERLVMRYRYIDGHSWTRICGELGYSESTIYRLHGQALLKLKEV